MSKQKNDSYLTGKLLLAMPTMSDPRFKDAVIFLCAHDAQGAMGIVLNQTLGDILFEDLLCQVGIKSDIIIDLETIDIPVMRGGPVDPERGFLLHSSDFMQQDTVTIDETYRVTGTIEALRDIACGKGPKDVIFALGYAGWSADQLDQEVQQNAWMIVDPSPDLIFKTKPEKKWSAAIATLGFDPNMLSSHAGRA